ncbi:hypothetical protein [Streptomyces camelliae]|uniref:Uncharacterized protein n=1 Tax=Streptomyces camelliae TaxID=3004093 RepID=A0ABY7P718_9ACTN|nr:hypothetical protein [Streptomyces sp. HUAS 2-6]WBO65128.1 hypothetical protein O1G22_20965 [Streptomyces sp. HUAS 2-6]
MSKFGNRALSVCITAAALVGLTATTPCVTNAAGTRTVQMADGQAPGTGASAKSTEPDSNGWW